MAASPRNHGPEVKKRCRELVRQGTSVQNIVDRLGVSKSYVKRERAVVQQQRKDDGSSED